MLIVHVGTQKTGTSALQGYLAHHADALLGQGVRYIEAGREGGNRSSHGDLAQSVLGRGDLAIWEKVRRELRESASRIDLISAEGFWFSDPAALKAELPETDEIQIVVYLRRQDKYLQSLWKQAVSGGRKHSFAEWRERLPFRGDYFSTLERWSAQFGTEAIVVRPYERNGAVNTVEDFCRIIGATGLPEQKNVGRNPSPRKELLQFIRAFNHLRAEVDNHQFFRALIFKNPEYVRSCDMLSYEEAAAVMKSYEESNRLLVDKYYRDDTVQLFPELTRTEPSAVWQVDSEEFFRLTVDVLDVVAQFAANGSLKLENPVVPRLRQHREAGTGGPRKKLDKSQRALRKAERAARDGASRQLPPA